MDYNPKLFLKKTSSLHFVLFFYFFCGFQLVTELKETVILHLWPPADLGGGTQPTPPLGDPTQKVPHFPPLF